MMRFLLFTLMRQRDRQYVPLISGENLGQVNDLADMITVMRHLFLNRPDDAFLLTADEDGLADVFRCEARQNVV